MNQEAAPTKPKPYVSITEAAEAIGTSRDRIINMVREGDLVGVKGHGRTSKWLVSRKSILAVFPEAQF